MRTTIIPFLCLLALVAFSSATVAQPQSASPPARIAEPEPHVDAPVEFSAESNDKEAVALGGPLWYDPLQVLYTEPVDAMGPPFPHDSQDFGEGYEIDALANYGDAYFWDVQANTADLVLSVDADPGTRSVFGETVVGIRGLLWEHADLYADNGGAGMDDEIVDLDGLELWGPWSDTVNPLSGWDANVFSVEGDLALWGAATPHSVYISTAPGGPPVPFISRTTIHAAVQSLGGFGCPEQEVDLDALMAWDGNFNSQWDTGDAIIFSIRAACGWDGGEIVVLPFGGPASFLHHGGHLWDTAFPVARRFGVDTEEVDAIEGVDAYKGVFMIPTVSEWGLLILGLLLLTGAKIYYGQRRRMLGSAG